MSSTQAQTLTKNKTNPSLHAVPSQAQTLPDAVGVIGELVEAYLKSKGAPQMVADEVSETIKTAAKTVPHWVIYLIVALASPLCIGIYAQYQTYKDLPARMTTMETQLNRIEDLMSPTSRPR